MTRTDHLAGDAADMDWLLAELEREGVPRVGCERVLRLVGELIDRGGLRRCEIRSALRVHVAAAREGDDLPTAEDGVLSAVGILAPVTLGRARRLARAVQLVKQRTPKREISAILRAQFGVNRFESCRLIQMATEMAGEEPT